MSKLPPHIMTGPLLYTLRTLVGKLMRLLMLLRRLQSGYDFVSQTRRWKDLVPPISKVYICYIGNEFRIGMARLKWLWEEPHFITRCLPSVQSSNVSINTLSMRTPGPASPTKSCIGQSNISSGVTITLDRIAGWSPFILSSPSTKHTTKSGSGGREYCRGCLLWWWRSR